MSKFLVASCLIFISCSALAAESMKVKIGGSLDTQAGYRQQKSTFNYSQNNINQPKLDKYGIINKTKINITAEGNMNNGIKYGALLILNADASANPYQGDNRIAEDTLFYLESKKYGRLEAGAYDGVANKMQVSANNIARATGGINGTMQKWINKKIYNSNYYATNGNQPLDFGQEFIKWPTLPVDCDFDSNISKITYYTPKIANVQLGVSYIPDVSRTGSVATINVVATPTTFPVGSPLNEVEGFKDIFEAGLKYTGKFQEIEFETSVIGERSQRTASRRGIFAYEVGATVSYKGFSVAGSYSDWTHSGAPRNRTTGQKYDGGYWTTGIAYGNDKYGISATYFNSRRANIFTGSENLGFLTTTSNRFEVLSIGTDYKIAPGLMPYAEVSFFKTKYYANSVNNRGSVILLGTKLTF